MIDWGQITLKELAGYVSEELRKRGIETILVGGACVTIYSENRYQSYDLDYITYEDMKKVKKALQELGFHEKARYYYHEGCQWIVEFVSPPIAVGTVPVSKNWTGDLVTEICYNQQIIRRLYETKTFRS